jgi:hypothetical protein
MKLRILRRGAAPRPHAAPRRHQNATGGPRWPARREHETSSSAAAAEDARRRRRFNRRHLLVDEVVGERRDAAGRRDRHAGGSRSLGGVTAVMVVGLTTVKLLAGNPPITTELAFIRFVPVIVTVVPPTRGPKGGVSELAIGGGTGARHDCLHCAENAPRNGHLGAAPARARGQSCDEWCGCCLLVNRTDSRNGAQRARDRP